MKPGVNSMPVTRPRRTMTGIHSFLRQSQSFAVSHLNYSVLFIFFLVLTLSFNGQAQTTQSRKRENFDVRKFHVKTFSIPEPSASTLLSNISGIIILDARADTGHVGLMQKKVIDPVLGSINSASRNRAEQRVNKTPTFLSLHQGLKGATTAYANAHFSFNASPGSAQVLMVIKRLWLSDELNLNDAPHANERLSRLFNKDYWTSGVDISVEFFLQEQNEYYPLYRYDSVITEVMTVSEYAPHFIAKALDLSLSRLISIDNRMSVVKNRRRFTLDEVTQHLRSVFEMPVLQDTVRCRGVYMSFEEFKNNAPSYRDFELQKDRFVDIVYIKQSGGKEYVERAVWGYCDGKNSYVRTGNNFFLLQRIENAFYIFGAKNINWEDGQDYNSGAYYARASEPLPVYYRKSKTDLQLKPFQLDWTTGMLY